MSATKRELEARAAVRDGAGGLRLRDQRARHRAPSCCTATTRCCRAGYYALIVPALAARRTRGSSRRRAAPNSTASAPPAARARARRHGRRRCSTACCPRGAGERRGAATSLRRAAGRERLRPRAARADPRRPAQRADRPGPEPPAGQHRHRGRRARRRDRRPRAAADAMPSSSAREALADGRGRGGLARRRGRQPLDAGGRRGQGAAPVLPSSAAGTARFIETHLAKSRRVGRQCGTPLPHVFTTSYLTHAPIDESPARHDGNYGYAGAAAALAGPRDRPAAGPDGARPALRLGGDCRSSCSTSRSRRCARACTPR